MDKKDYSQSYIVTKVLHAIRDKTSTYKRVSVEHGRCFEVHGWPFGLLLNGDGHYDLFGAHGLLEAVPEDAIPDVVIEIVKDLAADDGGWDFDPKELVI